MKGFGELVSANAAAGYYLPNNLYELFKKIASNQPVFVLLRCVP